MEFVEISKITGISGVIACAFYYLFKFVINKDIFPRLKTSQAFKILIVFLVLIWSLSVIAIFSWDYLEYTKHSVPRSNQQSTCQKLESMVEETLQKLRVKHAVNKDKFEDVKYIFLEEVLQRHLNAKNCDSLSIRNDIETAKKLLQSYEQ